MSRIFKGQWAGAIGNTVEWFDFAVYGYFARDIGQAFFPADVPSLQLIGAFGVFAVGYLMRPVGSVVLGPIGDLVGRRPLLLLSVALMSGCSLAIALLPTTQQWGITAALLLVLLRMIQGLSVGGEFPGSVVALVESAPKAKRGFYASFTCAGAILGFVGGSLSAALINQFLEPAAVAQWGWRIPFLIGAVLGAMALALRSSLEETRPVAVSATLTDHLRLVSRQWPAMLQLMGAISLSNVVFYIAAVFYVEALSARYPDQAANFSAVTTLNQAIGVGLILLGGWLCDRFEPIRLARRVNLAMAVVVVPGILLLQSGSLLQFAAGQLLVLIPLMLYLGIYPSFLPQLFPAEGRCSGFSFSYSLQVALLGGTAPLMATWLVERQGWSQGPAFYCLLWALPSLWALRSLSAERDQK